AAVAIATDVSKRTFRPVSHDAPRFRVAAVVANGRIARHHAAFGGETVGSGCNDYFATRCRGRVRSPARQRARDAFRSVRSLRKTPKLRRFRRPQSLTLRFADAIVAVACGSKKLEYFK